MNLSMTFSNVSLLQIVHSDDTHDDSNVSVLSHWLTEDLSGVTKQEEG